MTAGEPRLVSGLPVAIEIGSKRRVFAHAVDWPGWCRGARDEARAVESLVASAERYHSAVGDLAAPLGSAAPAPSIVERADGTATTDFGAPDTVFAFDRRPLQDADPDRLLAFLDACWRAFDAALECVPAEARAQKPAAGRSPDAMRAHLVGGLRGYLAWVVKPLPAWNEDRAIELEPQLRELLRGAVRRTPTGVPFEGQPRPMAYVVRRECWHALDHAWELEDRLAAT